MNIEAMAREARYQSKGLHYGRQQLNAQQNYNQQAYASQQFDTDENFIRIFAALVRAEALREAAGICADMHPFDNGVDCGQYILAAIDQPKEK